MDERVSLDGVSDEELAVQIEVLTQRLGDLIEIAADRDICVSLGVHQASGESWNTYNLTGEFEVSVAKMVDLLAEEAKEEAEKRRISKVIERMNLRSRTYAAAGGERCRE